MPPLAALAATLLLATSPGARAGAPQCQQCCQDAGLYSCHTQLRIYGEGGETRAEGGGWRVTGLWVLDCEQGARFDPTTTAVVQLEPRLGELVMTGTSRAAVECFRDWCQLPANACVQARPSGELHLVRCTDGQPMRASELLKPGAPPPSVYVSPTPQPNPGSVPAPRPAPTGGGTLTPAGSAASTAARAQAAPEAVFVTRTVTVSGGRTTVTETTSAAPVGASAARVAPAPTPPAPTPPEPVVRVIEEAEPAPSVPVVHAWSQAPQPAAAPPAAAPPAAAPPAAAPSAAAPSAAAPSAAAPSAAAPPAEPTGANIVIEREVVAETAIAEYPPHLPASGPLAISLAFAVPETPGSRCYTSSSVAAEATRRLDLGDEARLRSDHQTAVDEYRAAVTLDRCNAIAWAALGQLALQADDTDKAVTALEVATRLRPDHYGAWTHLGLAYEARGQDVAAREAFQRALAARPGHPPAAAGLERVGRAP